MPEKPTFNDDELALTLRVIDLAEKLNQDDPKWGSQPETVLLMSVGAFPEQFANVFIRMVESDPANFVGEEPMVRFDDAFRERCRRTWGHLALAWLEQIRWNVATRVVKSGDGWVNVAVREALAEVAETAASGPK